MLQSYEDRNMPSPPYHSSVLPLCRERLTEYFDFFLKRSAFGHHVVARPRNGFGGTFGCTVGTDGQISPTSCRKSLVSRTHNCEEAVCLYTLVHRRYQPAILRPFPNKNITSTVTIIT